jgi:endonuclease/exonuclease/phosphatase (EEP) superfamily protein YafD
LEIESPIRDRVFIRGSVEACARELPPAGSDHRPLLLELELAAADREEEKHG